MSESNGKSILSLEAARAQRPQKDNDFITVKQARDLAYDLVMQECAKVHEHYLTQIPVFVARQIQDALLLYGLVVPAPGTDITPESSASRDGKDALAAEGQTIPDGGHFVRMASTE